MSIARLGCASMMLLFSSPALPQITVTVDPHSVFQTFEGWGTSLCWRANMAGRFSLPTRMRIAQDLFTLNDGGLGFTIVRFNAGGGENPSIRKTMELRARMEGYWPGPDQSYNWTQIKPSELFLAMPSTLHARPGCRSVSRCSRTPRPGG